jgi:hypothetical protein
MPYMAATPGIYQKPTNTITELNRLEITSTRILCPTLHFPILYLYVALEQEPRDIHSGFGGIGVSTLASGTQVRGFEPGRRIFPSEGK